MHKVFLSGSMRIKNLDENVLERLNNIIDSNYEVIVGDAGGVDTSFQADLKDKCFDLVKVYCAGDRPRNNLGSWSEEHIHTSAKPGTRDYFTAKDVKMAKDCDYGFMVWDTKSTGTLSNAIELLNKKKSSLIYINKAKEFLAIKSVSDLEVLLSYMSTTAFDKANEKLKINDKVESFKNEQAPLF